MRDQVVTLALVLLAIVLVYAPLIAVVLIFDDPHRRRIFPPLRNHHIAAPSSARR